MSTEVLPLESTVANSLRTASTATLTTVLLKMGLRNVWIRGASWLGSGAASRPERKVGRAFTLRFVPYREDLATPQSWSSPISTRSAVEAMPPGCICVAGALGTTDAGIFGDILCARMKRRGVSALITDGVVRDLEGIRSTDLAVWARGTASPPSVNGLTFVNWQEPIGCGGVAVYPNDVVVADGDGAIVIPAKLVEEVACAAVDQERLEEWIMSEVSAGAALPGLYPPNEQNLARFNQGHTK